MSRFRCLSLLFAGLLIPALVFAQDEKNIGVRYRVKVTSAGIPTLGGVVSGYKLRTKYDVFGKDSKKLGTAYLGDYVYVPEPGDYRIVVNGQAFSESFQIPREMTPDRIKASWARSRAVELRPERLGRRSTVPSLWVTHPPQVTGDHNDHYVIRRMGGEAVVRGVTVVYPPEEIKDIDDGVLYANTLVHLLPGRYEIFINGARFTFEMKAGETKLLRLGALTVAGDVPAGTKLFQVLAGNKKLEVNHLTAGKWFVAPPGNYVLGKTGVVVKEAAAVTLTYKKPSLPSLRRPRLLVRAISDKGVRITGFLPGSPLSAAGLKVGDRIVAFDGTAVDGTRALARLLLEKKLGDQAVLTVERKGRAKPFDVKLQLGSVKPNKGKRKLF